MADRYTLPPEMGGHECEIVWRSSALVAGVEIAKVRYPVDGFEVTSEVLWSWLTSVKPPPQEPPNGSVVRVFRLGFRAVFERDDEAAISWPKDTHWFGTDRIDPYTWLDIQTLAETTAPVLLVPDPFAEPVQLPWRSKTPPTRMPNTTLGVAAVHCNKGLVASIQVIDSAYTITYDFDDPADAREYARAVWAAANQADKAGKHE